MPRGWRARSSKVLFTTSLAECQARSEGCLYSWRKFSVIPSRLRWEPAIGCASCETAARVQVPLLRRYPGSEAEEMRLQEKKQVDERLRSISGLDSRNYSSQEEIIKGKKRSDMRAATRKERKCHEDRKERRIRRRSQKEGENRDGVRYGSLVTR